MQKCQYSFLSISSSCAISFETSEPSDFIFEEFLMLFIDDKSVDFENNKIDIQSQQQYNIKFQKKLNAFIDKYQIYDKKFFKLRSYFQKLKENEYFLLWPTEDLNTEKRNTLYSYLMSLKENVDFEILKKHHKDLFSELLAVWYRS